MRCKHVLIIGDGVIGRVLAFALVTGPAPPAVTMAGGGGPGASAAAAGMLAPSFEVLHGRSVPGLMPMLAQALGPWDAFVHGLDADPASIGYDRSGIIAIDPLPVPSGDGDPAPVPSGLYGTAAFLRAGEGQVDPRALLRVLDARLTAAGVARIGALPVSVVGGAAPMARFADGTRVAADVIIVTAGMASAQLLTDVSLHPVRGRAVLVEDPIGLARVARYPDVYFCPKPGGTLYVGATEEARADDPHAFDAFWTRACTFCPALATAPVLARFDGLRPASAQGVPYIGPVADDPRLLVATGHDRNGVLLAPLTAHILLPMIADVL